jgi:two-component system, chemotaxis family, protein-glutamate methylesterase/glutaminase
MSNIRVLIVDDAVMIRTRLSKILTLDPDIEVVGTAASGKIALAKLLPLKPDIVILDVEMPELDGLQTLAQIRQTHPKLPIIMFSTTTTRGATATLDALTLGASDYVAKPSQLSNIEEITQYLQSNLIPKIKALSLKITQPISPTSPVPSQIFPTPTFSHSRVGHVRVDIVAIGVSTGGPNALATLLAMMPENFPVPIVIVQHMPPMFTALLAERLTAKCLLPVREAASGEVLQPGTVWLAPGDYHLSLNRSAAGVLLSLDQSPLQNSCRPSVDVLFKSVAQIYGNRALGVILTGMGQDGLRGCESIYAAQGQILAQDEASSVVWGMPGFVVKAGIADAVIPLEQVMPEILCRVNRFESDGRSA